MRLRLKAALLTTVLAFPASAGAAWAEGPTETVQAAVAQVFTESSAVQAEAASPAERRTHILEAAERLFDFREMARRCLGNYFDALSRPDQTEFVRLFTNLIAASYMGKIEAYTGESIRYLDEQVDGIDAKVNSRLVTRKGTEVDVAYRLYHAGDRWAVYDVSVDGVSLVDNYKIQFSRFIHRNSLSEFLKTLQQRAGS